MAEVNAVIQRISSGMDVLIAKMEQLHVSQEQQRLSHEALLEDFNVHRKEDRDDFGKVFTIIEANRRERNEQLDKVIDRLVDRIDGQDERISRNDITTSRAKGAGWVIIGIVTFLGTALLTLLGVLADHLWGH